MVELHQNLADTLIKKIVLVGTVMHIEKNGATDMATLNRTLFYKIIEKT
jgi:hypothetical protein